MAVRVTRQIVEVLGKYAAPARVTRQVVEVLAQRGIIELDAASTLVLAQIDHRWVNDPCSSTLVLSSEASRSDIFNRGITDTLALSQGSSGRCVPHVHSENTLTVSHSHVLIHPSHVSCTSTLELTDDNPVIRPWYLNANSTIELQDDNPLVKPIYLTTDNALITYTEQLVDDELVTIETGLTQEGAAALVRTAIDVPENIALIQTVSYTKVSALGISVTSDNTLSLSQSDCFGPTPESTSTLAITQGVSGSASKPVSNTIALVSATSAIYDRSRAPSSTLAISQTVTYVHLSDYRDVKHTYTPFIGEATDPNAPLPPSATLDGPMPGIVAPFQLVYPHTGAVTDSVTLRAPNLGNKDRLSFTRINRTTRGGTLIIFADPQWPKVQTLVLSFSALKHEEAAALLTFFETHAGQQIGLIDWEARFWEGVLTKTDPVIQDAFNSYSASFEFEGARADWLPQEIPSTPCSPVARIRETHSPRYHPCSCEPGSEEPNVPEAESFYSVEVDESVIIGTPIYIKAGGTGDLAQATTLPMASVAGIVYEATNAHFSAPYISEGQITKLDWTLVAGTVTLTPGANYFLSTSAGRITTTPPSGLGEYIVRVGRAVSSTTLDLEIEMPIKL